MTFGTWLSDVEKEGGEGNAEKRMMILGPASSCRIHKDEKNLQSANSRRGNSKSPTSVTAQIERRVAEIVDNKWLDKTMFFHHQP